MCGKPVQIITNYLPLANYLIDQEHDSVIIMGAVQQKPVDYPEPAGSENSLYAGHWMFTSGKGLTADGLYKTDMLTAMAEQKCSASSGNWSRWSIVVNWRARGNAVQPRRSDRYADYRQNANPQVLQQLEARCKHTPRLKMLSEKRYRRRQRFWRNAMPHACGP